MRLGSGFTDGVTTPIGTKRDIVEIVGQYTRLTRLGDLHRGLCPLTPETNPSFTIYTEQQRFYCFSCDAHGDVLTFLQLINPDLPWSEVVRQGTIAADNGAVPLLGVPQPTTTQDRAVALRMLADVWRPRLQGLLSDPDKLFEAQRMLTQTRLRLYETERPIDLVEKYRLST